jgi:YD repeat-containing protein
VNYTGERYQDVAYAYDAWGTLTRETVYLNEVASGAASSGAGQTTLTCYGELATGIVAGEECATDGYHTYPAWQMDAAGQFTRWSYDPAVPRRRSRWT